MPKLYVLDLESPKQNLIINKYKKIKKKKNKPKVTNTNRDKIVISTLLT